MPDVFQWKTLTPSRPFCAYVQNVCAAPVWFFISGNSTNLQRAFSVSGLTINRMRSWVQKSHILYFVTNASKNPILIPLDADRAPTYFFLSSSSKQSGTWSSSISFILNSSLDKMCAYFFHLKILSVLYLTQLGFEKVFYLIDFV